MTSMLSIYNYDDAGSFLKDAWTEKKHRNPSFSMRAWAKILGLSNNSTLSSMLQGKRPIPSKYIPTFIESLGLSTAEGMYLEALLAYSRAKLPLKDFYYSRLQSLAPKPIVRMFEVDSFKALSNPLHAALVEMTDLKSFKSDAKWIQEKLNSKTTLAEVEEAIDRLFVLGLLKEDAAGRICKTHQHASNRADIADQGSREYHRRVSELAAKAVTEQPLQSRDFNGFALNICKKDLPAIKKLIQQTVDDLISKIEAPAKSGDTTCQLNVQFFSLTKF